MNTAASSESIEYEYDYGMSMTKVTTNSRVFVRASSRVTQAPAMQESKPQVDLH